MNQTDKIEKMNQTDTDIQIAVKKSQCHKRI